MSKVSSFYLWLMIWCIVFSSCWMSVSQSLTTDNQCTAEVACTKEEEGLALPEQTTLCPRIWWLRREERPLARLRLVARAGPDWLHQYCTFCLRWHHFPLLAPIGAVHLIYDLFPLMCNMHLFHSVTTVTSAACSIKPIPRSADTSQKLITIIFMCQSVPMPLDVLISFFWTKPTTTLHIVKIS